MLWLQWILYSTPWASSAVFDEVIFATRVPDTDANAVHTDGVLSCSPEFVVCITASETTSNLVMEGLTVAEITGVYCNPVKIGPRYPQPQFPLLGSPPTPPGHQAEDPDDLVMMLQECCPMHR